MKASEYKRLKAQSERIIKNNGAKNCNRACATCIFYYFNPLGWDQPGCETFVSDPWDPSQKHDLLVKLAKKFLRLEEMEKILS